MSYRSSFRIRCWPREKIQAEKPCKKYEMICAVRNEICKTNVSVTYYNNVSTIKHERKYLPGIMKNAANVEIAVMVTLRSRLPPNITVQILEAPPPGEQPVTKRPSLF